MKKLIKKIFHITAKNQFYCCSFLGVKWRIYSKKLALQMLLDRQNEEKKTLTKLQKKTDSMKEEILATTFSYIEASRKKQNKKVENVGQTVQEERRQHTENLHQSLAMRTADVQKTIETRTAAVQRDVQAVQRNIRTVAKEYAEKNREDILEVAKDVKSLVRDESFLDSCMNMIPTEKLLTNQYNGEAFDAYDVIVRYLAIEAMYGKNDYGIYLYEKMQKARGTAETHSIERFKQLVEAFEQSGGYQMNEPVSVDSAGILIDGSHRLACVLYFECPFITAAVSRDETRERNYSLDFFRKNDFSEMDICHIVEKQKELFYNRGLFNAVMFWADNEQNQIEFERLLERFGRLKLVKRQKVSLNRQQLIDLNMMSSNQITEGRVGLDNIMSVFEDEAKKQTFYINWYEVSNAKPKYNRENRQLENERITYLRHELDYAFSEEEAERRQICLWWLVSADTQWNRKIVERQPNFEPLEIKEAYESVEKADADKIDEVRNMNISDFFFAQYYSGTFQRMDLIVMAMAVECYYGKNDFGIEFYLKMQQLRTGKTREELSEKLKEEIELFEKQGALARTIFCDERLNIAGREIWFALCIYHNVETINITRLKGSRHIVYNRNWFAENNFVGDYMSQLLIWYEEIAKKLNKPFVCTLWSPAEQWFDEIQADIGNMYEILESKDIEYPNDFSFENVVRCIYAVDDIAQWKITKKLEHMQPYPNKIRVLYLQFKNPEFRLKDSTKMPLSKEGEKLKRIFRNKYKVRVPNYFHDIILHTSDNYEQASYMRRLFEIKLDVSECYERLGRKKFVVTKFDVPYMPTDYPYQIPFHKDADIVCIPETYEQIVDIVGTYAKEFCEAYYLTFVEIEDSHLHRRFRMELDGYLIYQFDVSAALEQFSTDFVIDMVSNRRFNGRIWVPDEKYEVLLRLAEYKKNEKKIYHLEYVQKHMDAWDERLAEKYIIEGAIEDWRNLIEDCGKEV